MSIYFTSPCPQRHDLKEGDFIGFSGKFISVEQEGSKKFRAYSSKLLKIYLRNHSCKVVGISKLSIPIYEYPCDGEKKDFVKVTGVIIAVQTIEKRMKIQSLTIHPTI